MNLDPKELRKKEQEMIGNTIHYSDKTKTVADLVRAYGEISKLRAEVERLNELHNAEAKVTNKCIDENLALKAKLEAANSELDHVGESKGGCCDHACLIEPPTVGTTGGKCYCSQGKVRRYISTLRAEIDRLKVQDLTRKTLLIAEIYSRDEEIYKLKSDLADEAKADIEIQETVKKIEEENESYRKALSQYIAEDEGKDEKIERLKAKIDELREELKNAECGCETWYEPPIHGQGCDCVKCGGM